MPAKISVRNLAVAVDKRLILRGVDLDIEANTIVSVIGIPPFGGFFSKFLVIMGTVRAGMIALAAISLFTAVLTMLYLMRVFALVFLGEAKSPAPEKTKSMVFVVALLAVLSLLSGLFVSFPAKLAAAATTHISGWLR